MRLLLIIALHDLEPPAWQYMVEKDTFKVRALLCMFPRVKVNAQICFLDIFYDRVEKNSSVGRYLRYNRQMFHDQHFDKN